MKKNQIILISIGVLVLIGFVFSFGYWQKLFKPETGIDPCKNFSKVEGEITCQEAKEVVLEKYQGEIKYVEKSNIPVQIGKPPETETIQKDVWLVGIRLEKPNILPSAQISEQATSSGQTSEIEVAIDRYGKNILFFQTECPKCSK